MHPAVVPARPDGSEHISPKNVQRTDFAHVRSAVARVDERGVGVDLAEIEELLDRAERRRAVKLVTGQFDEQSIPSVGTIGALNYVC